MEALFDGAEKVATSISNWAKAPLKENMDLLQLTALTVFTVSLAVFTASAFKTIVTD